MSSHHRGSTAPPGDVPYDEPVGGLNVVDGQITATDLPRFENTEHAQNVTHAAEDPGELIKAVVALSNDMLQVTDAKDEGMQKMVTFTCTAAYAMVRVDAV